MSTARATESGGSPWPGIQVGALSSCAVKITIPVRTPSSPFIDITVRLEHAACAPLMTNMKTVVITVMSIRIASSAF